MRASQIYYLGTALCVTLFACVAANDAEEKGRPSSILDQIARTTSSARTLAQLRAEAHQLARSLTFQRYTGERLSTKFLYGGKPRGIFTIFERSGREVTGSLEVDGKVVMKFDSDYGENGDQLVAKVKIGAENDECILVYEFWGRTSACRYHLHLLIPRRKVTLVMRICVPWDVGSLPSYETSDNFNQPDLKPYADFLNRLRYAYGDCTEREILENPEPGWNDEEYCWIKYNADITSGILRIRRAKGLDAYSTEGAILIHDGPIVYIGHPNGGGVFVEDRQRQEHYILYYPSPGREGMTNMMKSGSRLFIEVPEDGFVVVDTKAFSMRHLRPRYGKVESADASDSGRLHIIEDDPAWREAIRLQRDQRTAMLRNAADAITSPPPSPLAERGRESWLAQPVIIKLKIH